MRVLFFNYEYPPLGGGAGNASFYLLREYAKIPNLKIDFITSSIDEHYYQEKVGENIFIHRLPIGKNKQNIHFQSQADLLRYTKAAYKFAKVLIKENKYDLTHSFFTVPCGYISLKLKQKFKLPYIVSLRGSDVPYYSERFTFIYKLLMPLIKRIWKNAEFVIANSEGLKKLALRSDPGREIGIIYNGIDIAEFRPQPELKDPKKFQIICVSRVTPRKGIRFLVQAFKNIAEKFPQAQLLVIGDGNEKQSLMDLARALELGEKAVFLGLVSHEKLSQYYAKASIFVLPSLNEGMSNTMLEAIASGLPIIATDTGGTKELVKEGMNGFIVPMQDNYAITQKIEKLIENPHMAEQFGIESRRRAEELSWKNVAKQYADLYQEVNNIEKMRRG